MSGAPSQSNPQYAGSTSEQPRPARHLDDEEPLTMSDKGHGSEADQAHRLAQDEDERAAASAA